ncbi:hypothetical protein OROHE_013490 [Orobanche hederae]
MLSRTWSKFASGLIATNTGFSHSRKFSTGVFSSLEIFFSSLSLIALSEKLCLSDRYRRVNAALLTQHPLSDPLESVFEHSRLLTGINKAPKPVNHNHFGFAQIQWTIDVFTSC